MVISLVVESRIAVETEYAAILNSEETDRTRLVVMLDDRVACDSKSSARPAPWALGAGATPLDGTVYPAYLNVAYDNHCQEF
jgi:hypothetical protein